jgi:hypothetical protein
MDFNSTCILPALGAITLRRSKVRASAAYPPLVVWYEIMKRHINSSATSLNSLYHFSPLYSCDSYLTSSIRAYGVSKARKQIRKEFSVPLLRKLEQLLAMILYIWLKIIHRVTKLYSVWIRAERAAGFAYSWLAFQFTRPQQNRTMLGPNEG